MTKSTGAVILTSPARLAPWGDDAWRFTGAMQLVLDGPDWLHAGWTTPGEAEGHKVPDLAMMVLRDAPQERAADIAVMTLSLLDVAGWRELEPWWRQPEDRSSLTPRLHALLETSQGELKLAVIETEEGALPIALLEELRRLGIEVEAFVHSA